MSTTSFSQQVLARFAQQQWGKAQGYLKKHFGLSGDDCADVFQEAFITLYNNNREGRLTSMGSSLSTYFIRICHNKALELLRQRGRYVAVDQPEAFDVLADVQDDKLNTLLTFDPDSSLKETKEALARQIVRDLPRPCNQLLWGFFRDGLRLKTLAEMLGKTEGYVKVTKHRCQEKFRKHWQRLASNLF